MDAEIETPESLLQRGLDAHDRGELQEARASYLQILRDHPDDANVLQLLGLIEFHSRRLNNAERVLRRSVAAQPEQAAAWITLARVMDCKRRPDAALDCYAAALRNDPLAAEAWHRRALLNKRMGCLQEAESDLREGVRLQPLSARLHNDLGTVLKLLGRHRDAVSSFERAIRARPDYAIAHNNLGVSYLEEGRLRQAARCFENALIHKPDMAPAHDNLGIAYRESGEAKRALEFHDTAIRLAPGFALAHVHRAQVLGQLGREAEAEQAYRVALAMTPTHAGALAGIARLLESRGEYQQGLELVEESARAPDAPPELRIAAARLMRRVYRGVEALELLQPLMRGLEQGAALSAPVQRDLHFTLGRLFDQETRFAAAFEHFSAGNRLHASGFDPARWVTHIDSLISHFSRSALDMLPRGGEGEDLVFIVGMPRAGAGLLQQVLAAHPDVFAAASGVALGDLTRDLCKRLGTPQVFPECVGELTAPAVRNLIRDYRAALGTVPPGAARVCATEPLNFLHLGMIEVMFPKARVIHCVRDPMDTALSCFFQDFAGPALDFATRLHNIVLYYRQYRRLMTHWKSVSRLPVFELRHEKLVLDQEGAVRALLAFLDLPWHSQCLRFHEVEPDPGSAVAKGSRQPIYRTSIGRHLNYERFLQPFRDQLSG